MTIIPHFLITSFINLEIEKIKKVITKLYNKFCSQFENI